MSPFILSKLSNIIISLYTFKDFSLLSLLIILSENFKIFVGKQCKTIFLLLFRLEMADAENKRRREAEQRLEAELQEERERASAGLSAEQLGRMKQVGEGRLPIFPVH